VWPFVQGYWGWAAAARGAVDVFATELAALADLAGRAPTFHEFYHPDSGRPGGSARQLWSAAGYLALVHHGLFGLAFDGTELRFNPVVPAGFPPARLSGFRHRDLTLDVTITGTGTRVARCTVDGVPSAPVLPTTMTGTHRVDLTVH
jgi:hypothetical protein